MPAKTNAETKESLEVQKLKLEIARLKYDIEEDKRMALSIESSSDAARVYSLTGEITNTSVKHTIDRVTQWYREDQESPIEIVINSGGGSIFAGMALYDYLRIIGDSGTPVITTAVGLAASMAGILLQAGTHRRMSANSWLMIHEASTSTWGKSSELRDEVELIEKLDSTMLAILAERSKLSVKQIRAKSARRDWWLTASEALDLGLCDEVS